MTRELIILMSIAIPFEIVAYYIYLSAIRITPLSLCVPYLSFTPVFAIVTASVILKEAISLHGIIGILTVTVGAYVLNIEHYADHPFAPLKAIVKSSGARRMLTVALIWSFTATLGKQGVYLSDPMFFSFFYTVSISAAMLIIAGWRLSRGKTTVNLKGRNSIWLLLAGMVSALATIFHFHAIRLAPVSYMIAVKRTSLVFSVLYGGLIFKEERIRLRLIGTSIMLAGAVLLYIES